MFFFFANSNFQNISLCKYFVTRKRKFILKMYLPFFHGDVKASNGVPVGSYEDV